MHGYSQGTLIVFQAWSHTRLSVERVHWGGFVHMMVAHHLMTTAVGWLCPLLFVSSVWSLAVRYVDWIVTLIFFFLKVWYKVLTVCNQYINLQTGVKSWEHIIINLKTVLSFDSKINTTRFSTMMFHLGNLRLNNHVALLLMSEIISLVLNSTLNKIRFL